MGNLVRPLGKDGPRADRPARSDGRGRVKAIKLAIQERIGSDAYKLGERLPSERQLCLEFETSRVTLHEILIQLEAEGLIYREERRGWFVSPPRFVYDPQSRGHFTLSAQQQGHVPSTRVIDRQFVLPPARVVELLGVRPDIKMACIRRVRSIDGRAVLYVEHYLQADIFPGLFEHDLSASLTELYRDTYGFHYGRMKYQITPTAVSGDAAAMLRVAGGSPALLVTRVNHGLDSGIRDCDFEYWRHDAILIEVEVAGT